MNALILRRSFALIALLMLALLPSAQASSIVVVGTPQTIHVSADYAKIQDAINAANNGDTVLVADGTYTGDGNRDIDFHGKNITVTSQNGPTKTIIDCGGYGTKDGSGDHRGFYLHSGETNATIRGFTVKNGFEVRVLSIPDSDQGGGICIDTVNGGVITVVNCTITSNAAHTTYVGGKIVGPVPVGSSGEGSGVFNSNNNGTTILTDCIISNNNAGYAGGGVYNSIGTITLTSCIVSANYAANAGGGGGVYNLNGTATLTNCTISANQAYMGNGIYNSDGTTTLTNDIIYGDQGGEVVTGSGAVPTASFSDIQGGYTGTGNIDQDPLFVNAATGDLHLKPGSPCLGKGTPLGAPATDLDGNPRPNPPSMGAYELGVVPAAITGFTLSPNQLDAPGPRVTANVSVMGNFSKVTVSCAPGTLSIASPTFNLLANSGGGWGGSFPTTFLRTAKTNPITFIATGTRADGTTATMATTLQIGALPTLTLKLSPDNTAIHRNQTFNLTGYVSDLASVPAPNTTVQITEVNP